MNTTHYIMIRLAKENDINQLEKLFLVTRQQSFKWESPEKFKKEDYKKSVEGEEVWVAEVDDQIVGFVSIWIPNNFIHNLFVHPSWQHKGIGRKLLQKAEERIPSSLMQLKVLKKNTRAYIFYQKQGWEIKSTHSDTNEGEYYLLQYEKKW